MSPTPIVHIGYHKTATTWFQDVFYPAAHARYVPRDRVYQALVAPDGFSFDAAQARAVIGPADGAILCEENLSGYVHNGGLSGFASRAVAERIHAAMPNARIVVFVRAQPSMAAAAYLQYVRTGGTRGPSRYLFPSRYLRGAAADPYKAPRFAIGHFAYHRLIEHYAALFGPEAVHVFAYEDFKRDPESFARRYAERMQIEVNWSRMSFAARNMSYGRAGLILSRLLNHFTRRAVIDKDCLVHVPGLYSARRWLMERLNALPGRTLSAREVLGERLHDEVAAYFTESNAQLAAGFGLDLASQGYPLPQQDTRSSASSPDKFATRLAGARAVP